jgi:hypothetical protein
MHEKRNLKITETTKETNVPVEEGLTYDEISIIKGTSSPSPLSPCLQNSSHFSPFSLLPLFSLTRCLFSLLLPPFPYLFLLPLTLKFPTGALDLTDKKAADVLTSLTKCFMLNVNEVLSQHTLKLIKEEGHSRVPVYKDSREVQKKRKKPGSGD